MAKVTNKEKALTALLECPTITEAAAKCGLSQETLYRYLREKDFLSDYREARRSIMESAITELQKSAGDAVETLKRNQNCENPAVEIRAAQAILDLAFRGIETTDILQRLETIENEFENQNKKN
ncbi:MAG TPA: helix-turn-helix domain-containing protein [Pyrinomonadaceae bacterium]|nr:helix-turn-helix domain-containing protein [Pyrinomonadaceae bacterium]